MGEMRRMRTRKTTTTKMIKTRRRRMGEMTRRKGEKSRRRTGTVMIQHMGSDSNTTNNVAHGNMTSNPWQR